MPISYREVLRRANTPAVTERVRIGELLLREETVDPWQVTQALRDQAATRQRMLSLLIQRALIDHDEGAALLSQQLGYPAAMQRHIERRDPATLRRIPEEIGARWVVLPLAFARSGHLVVVARDPNQILAASLEHVTKVPILLSVMPSIQLERLIRTFYGAPGSDEQPLPYAPPTLADIGNVRLDDTPIPRRARTVSRMMDEEPELPVRAPSNPSALDALRKEVRGAVSSMAVERLVLAYAERRWQAALLFHLVDGWAFGVRGHGGAGIDSIRLPLSAPSLLTVARDTREPVLERPIGRVQGELTSLLWRASAPAAVPVIVGGNVEMVLAVGDPLDARARTTIAELDLLADVLGTAYERFGIPSGSRGAPRS